MKAEHQPDTYKDNASIVYEGTSGKTILSATGCSLLGVDPAQVRVPANRDDVGKEKTILQGNEREVDNLDSRPEHPVCLQSRPPCLVDALLRTLAFHGGHATKKDTDHDRRKAKLVASDTGEDFGLLVRHVDPSSKEGKPSSSDRAENNCQESVSVE